MRIKWLTTLLYLQTGEKEQIKVKPEGFKGSVLRLCARASYEVSPFNALFLKQSEANGRNSCGALVFKNVLFSRQNVAAGARFLIKFPFACSGSHALKSRFVPSGN